MLLREGDQRTTGIDIRLASLLAAVGGALNAAGFQAAGLFSANMTGNVSALSDHLGLAQFGLAALFFSLVIAFIMGAFISGILIEAGRKRGVRAIYAYSIALEGVLLLFLGLSTVISPTAISGSSLVLTLSFVMGLQNAATTRISDARVRTTHVSGLATDIGLAFAALASHRKERDAVIARLNLHLCTIASFFVGGIGGVMLFLWIEGWFFLVCATVLLLIALPQVNRARQGQKTIAKP